MKNNLSNVIVICGMAIALLVSAGQTASASPVDKAVQMNRSEIAELTQRLHDGKKAIDRNHGSRVDQFKAYLNDAMMLVYLAKVNANLEWTAMDSSNLDLKSLVQSGYLSEWPANPLDDWKPMKVLKPGDPFAAGSLVFDLCPATQVTTNAGQQHQASFNLYVYGLDANLVIADAAGPEENKAWSHPPAGYLYGTGYYTSSDSDRAELKVKNKARKAKQAQEKDKAPGTQPH